ncbi:hypothetical protein EHYA_05047 [Embleya hyalina]|uniref:Uncharacterized protein n=1 Tax=Embleya hyalina TaxID=516124 RepID=A0A401YS17_9ACTN|nr:hypothetical protein EHYA_05047 [Embleya hyalina]
MRSAKPPTEIRFQAPTPPPTPPKRPVPPWKSPRKTRPEHPPHPPLPAGFPAEQHTRFVGSPASRSPAHRQRPTTDPDQPKLRKARRSPKTPDLLGKALRKTRPDPSLFPPLPAGFRRATRPSRRKPRVSKPRTPAAARLTTQATPTRRPATKAQHSTEIDRRRSGPTVVVNGDVIMGPTPHPRKPARPNANGNGNGSRPSPTTAAAAVGQPATRALVRSARMWSTVRSGVRSEVSSHNPRRGVSRRRAPSRASTVQGPP